MVKRVSIIAFLGLLAVYGASYLFAQGKAGGSAVIKGIVLNGSSVSSAPGEAVVRAGGRWVDATVGMALMPGDEIRTGSSSQVWVEFSGGGEGVIDSGSRFVVKGDRTLLGVIGETWLRVKGRFRVETERVAAAVTGTEFGIELKSDGKMMLVVLDGAVSVEGLSGTTEVRRSEMVEADPRGVVGAPQKASRGILDRTWELAWDVRRAVSGMVAEVAFVSGSASVERGGKPIAVELGMALLRGDKLSVSENARLEVRLKDRAALDIKGVDGLDVGAIVGSKDPRRRLWAETVWNKVQRVVTGGTSSGTTVATVVGGVRGAEAGREEEPEFLGGEEEEKAVTPAEVETAIINLLKVVEGGGPQAEEALYLIAESYRYLSEAYYKRVIEEFPNGKYTDRARERIGER
jgi:putative intracellular protease/amidase